LASSRASAALARDLFAFVSVLCALSTFDCALETCCFAEETEVPDPDCVELCVLDSEVEVVVCCTELSPPVVV
jgi:hypothetical protein